jgi:ABC-type glycerol-3-phosphate transport system substrate-binding protein
MKLKKLILGLAIISFAAAACGGKTPGSTSSDLPTPHVIVAAAPKVEDTVRTFLGAWESENYDAMYQQLSSASKQAITAEDFSLFYRNRHHNEPADAENRVRVQHYQSVISCCQV